MIRLTIELDDETYARLAEMATAKGMSVERAATAMLTARVAQTSPREFEAIVAQVLEEYRPVLRRLAE
jgi:plasmid stability protein